MNDDSVSAVIPSLGRDSLKSAIASALNQTHKLDEVIVVLNGRKDFKSIIESLPKDDRLIVHKMEKNGSSAARNAGISIAKSRFIAFLDDDDIWHLNKIETQLRENKKYNADILSCRAQYRGRINAIKPRKILDNNKILEKIYASALPFGRKYAIPTPTLLVRADLAKKIPFDETLTEREDLWFLHALQKNGATLKQIPDVLVTVNSRNLAGDREISITSDLEWFSRLESVQKFLGWKFLFGVGLRNRIIAKGFISGFELLRAAFKI